MEIQNSTKCVTRNKLEESSGNVAVKYLDIPPRRYGANVASQGLGQY